jgi:asparagine synthase (glutamine-hydrolysing)
VCGIAGLLSLDGRAPVDRGALEAMSAALIHRGPDSHGAVAEGPVGLAARRLSIIDLDTGDQPIRNEDGSVVVVQNGEIYNYEALRDGLGGHEFSTHGDTEVLAHLYEEHGPRFVTRLRGMFAIALWDARERRLVLARDPFGIKPLYYATDNGTLAFASELKALQKRPRPSTDVDLDAVTAFLAFNSIPAPLSIYAAVRKLPPGHLLIAEAGEIRIECFARPKPTARLRTESAKELAEEARTRLRDSVRAHLVADVPVGVLLSGGIDSSLLTALAAQEAGERVSTFSIGFKERSFDELDLARQVAGLYGTDHHELVVEPDAAELLPKIVAAFDEPFADSSALPTYLVSQLAAEHVKVVLSGEGGDELFGGYETYAADLLAPRLKPFLGVLDPLARALPSGSGRVPLDYKLKRFTAAAHLPPLERHHGFKEIFSTDMREQLLEDDRRSGVDPLDFWREAWEETEGVPELARLQHVDRAVYLVDDLLVKTDRMSMAHSLEARVPFLDPVVAELAHALPTSMKVRGTQKKRLLRMAAEPLLPRTIVRGRKRGFSIPAAAWLRGPLEPFAREVLSAETVRRQGFFAPAAVTRVLDEHAGGRVDHSRQLWGLMSFTLWRSGG